MSNTLRLTTNTKKALVWAIGNSIDMLNDMALDPMFMCPSQIRELASKSDVEIQKILRAKADEADENIEQLVNLQLLYSELKAE